MVNIIILAFALICSFIFTNSYVITVPDDATYTNDISYQPTVEVISEAIQENKHEESRPKDEFELIEAEPAKPIYEEVPELQPYPTFMEDNPLYYAPAVSDFPEDWFVGQDRSVDLDELKPSMVEENDLVLQFMTPDYLKPQSDEFMPSMINGKESSFPRLSMDDDVFGGEFAAILVKMWILEYCSVHPECNLENLEAELAKIK